jgi:hypothetical protein
VIGQPFIAVIPQQVQALGSVQAATVLAHLSYLTTDQTDGVVLTTEQLAQGTGLSVRTTQRITTRLRDLGVLTAVRAESWKSTMRWQVVRDHPVVAGHTETAKVAAPRLPKLAVSQTAKVAASPPHSELIEELPPTEQGTLPFLASVPDLPAEPEGEDQQGPPKTAQLLVARWCDGYRSVNDGADAHKAVMGRVAGQARNLAKACGDDHNSWVDAYHAAYSAGVAGSWDFTRHLVPQQQRRSSTAKRNVFAEPSMGGPGAETMARFQSMMDTSGPRALESGS